MDGASFFTAELNKVFGKEMANMISAEITDEELLRHARIAWQEVTKNNGWNDSTIKEHLKREYINRLKDHISEVIQEMDEKALRAEAESLVQQMMDEARTKMVQKVSDNMASMIIGGYGMGAKGMIEQVVMEMMSHH